MSQIEYSQTLGQQKHIEYLLTKEAFNEWLPFNLFYADSSYIPENRLGICVEMYLKEHGLPLDSEIKGL